jgi:hypothetical protein
MDPFDEFEDSPELDDDAQITPPTDPVKRQRFELAKLQLDVLLDPRFQQAMREFRLESPGKLIQRNARRLRERAYLLDPSRLMMSTLVRIVMHRDDYDGEKARPAWIDDRVDESIAELLTQDREDERSRLPLGEPLQTRFAHLARCLQIEPDKTRLACIRINELPTPTRKVFFELVCMLEPTRALVERGLGKKQELRALFRAALETLERSEIGFDSRNFHQGAGTPLDLTGGFDA